MTSHIPTNEEGDTEESTYIFSVTSFEGKKRAFDSVVVPLRILTQHVHIS